MNKHNIDSIVRSINSKRLTKPAVICISLLFIISLLSFGAFIVQADTQIPILNATASSYSSRHAPNLTIDGIESTSNYWGTYSHITSYRPQWLTLDLGTQSNINQVVTHFYDSDSRIFTYNIQVSTDGTAWTTIVPSKTGTSIMTDSFDQVTARYVRITITGNTASNSALIEEVKIYQSTNPTSTPSPSPSPSLSPTPKPTITSTPSPSPTPTPSPTGTNIVQNGGFESGISPWVLLIVDPLSKGYAGTLTQSTDACVGSYSGLFTVTGNPQGGQGCVDVELTFPAQVEQAYTLQLCYKGTMTVWANVFCFTSSWNNLGVFSVPTLTSTDTWTSMSMTFSVPLSTAITQIHFDVASTGTFQVDGVTVTSQTVTPSPSPTVTPSPSPTSSPSPQSSISIYSDQSCNAALSSFNWGTLSPGTTSTLVVYVKNQGNTAVTLSKGLSNFNPSSLSSYLNLNWDYSNQILNPGTILKITLSLTVSSNTPATSSFGFSTTITATGS